MSKACYITNGIESDYNAIALDVLDRGVTRDELMSAIHTSAKSSKNNASIFLDGAKYGMAKAMELMMNGKLNIKVVKKD